MFLKNGRHRDRSRFFVQKTDHRGDGGLNEIGEHGALEISVICFLAWLTFRKAVDLHARGCGKILFPFILDATLAAIAVDELFPVDYAVFVQRVASVKGHVSDPLTRARRPGKGFDVVGDEVFVHKATISASHEGL